MCMTCIRFVSHESTSTVYPKKYAHGFCFALLYCGYTLTDFPISIRLSSLALWQSNDCPSASKATLINMDKYFMWIHYERLHNHNKAKHNKTVCIFLGTYCMHARYLCHQASRRSYTLYALPAFCITKRQKGGKTLQETSNIHYYHHTWFRIRNRLCIRKRVLPQKTCRGSFIM